MPGSGEFLVAMSGHIGMRTEDSEMVKQGIELCSEQSGMVSKAEFRWNVHVRTFHALVNIRFSTLERADRVEFTPFFGTTESRTSPHQVSHNGLLMGFREGDNSSGGPVRHDLGRISAFPTTKISNILYPTCP